jgi:hypothetical protein
MDLIFMIAVFAVEDSRPMIKMKYRFFADCPLNKDIPIILDTFGKKIGKFSDYQIDSTDLISSVLFRMCDCNGEYIFCDR